MTRVCLVGDADVNLRYELLSRETSRQALATYDLTEPFANAVGLETVSLGAAVSLLNDLNWYLVRFVDEAMILEPSVSDGEWLSRDLATAIRDDEVDPDGSARFLKVYGLQPPSDATRDERDGTDGSATPGDGPSAGGKSSGEGGESDQQSRASDGDPVTDSSSAPDPNGDENASARSADEAMRLVEPMFVTRTGGDLPEYDLRDVESTLVERVTESEFGA